LHDLTKWEKDSDYNIYTYWLLKNNLFIKGKDDLVQQLFLQQVKILIF